MMPPIVAAPRPILNRASDIVELVVFSNDDAFMQTLREAVGASRRLWHVPAADKIGDLLLAGQVGILVLDAQFHPEGTSAFIAAIKRQFPDLVVLVAGNREAEASVARLLSDGTVYRFIHKPMSPGRAKLFADAAVKKFAEQRVPVQPPPPVPRVPAGRRRMLIAGGVLALAALCAAAAWYAAREMRGPAPSSPIVNTGSSGADDAARARDETRERLLAQVEDAILEERLSDAEAAIAAARSAGVEGGRITFLSAQLAKTRQQQKAAARQKIGPHPDGEVDETKLQQLLSDAAQRLKEGRLMQPDQDSAKFYVQEALRIDPNGNATQAARETLAKAFMAGIHAAIEQGDFASAAGLLDGADGIAVPSNVENARRELAAARQRAASASADQLLKSARDRLQRGLIVEPPGDNAKYFLMSLRDVDPGNSGLQPALEDLGSRMVTKARQALDQKDFNAVRYWLKEATSVGYASTASIQTLADLNAATDRQQFLDNVVDGSTLTLASSAKPEYPPSAERSGTQGWVELEFTVAETGAVEDISVRSASPPGVFDKAAVAALTRWRYQPVTSDGKPVAQRARIRMRFTLAK